MLPQPIKNNSFDPPKRDRLQPVPLDKILLGIGISYLGLVILWLSSQQYWPGSMNPSATSNPAGVISSRDRFFIAYLQQSLKTLDRNPSSRSQQSPPFPITTYFNTISPPPINASHRTIGLLPKGKNTTTGISPMIVLSSRQPPPSEPLTRILLPPPKMRSPQIPVIPLPPTTVPVLLSPNPRLPTVNNALSSPSLAPENHNLVGLLESGDQSTILVTFNGITRRFSIRETIGSSGWRLVSVSNQKAIIVRNGVTRSVDVGQGF